VPAASGVGRSSRYNRLSLFTSLAVLLAVVTGAYLIKVVQPGGFRSDSATASAPVDLEERFEVSEESIRKSPENLTTQPTPSSPPVDEKPETAPSSDPTPRERAAILVADAALALGNGKIEEASSLISRGEQIDPRNPRWAHLRSQLRAKQAETQWKSFAVDHIREAKRFLDAGDYQKAIDAYRKAIEYDLGNPEARSGLDRAIGLKQQSEEALERSTAASPRRFAESETEFVPGISDSSELMGFEMEEGFEIKETADPFFPAQVIIELNPTDAKPGEPYVLRVRIFNDGYGAIEFQSLELVSRFGGKTFGKGQQIPLRTQRVAPKATAVLHEIAGTWQETQNQGEIEVTVTLVNGGRLIKSVRW